MPRYFTIGETADYFGVSVDTIRRWESEGRITSQRTKGGHRRFLASALAGIEEEERNEKPTRCYARVSTRDKKDDLERQANTLVAYCENKGWQVELIKDIGSGLNYKKRGNCSPQQKSLIKKHYKQHQLSQQKYKPCDLA